MMSDERTVKEEDGDAMEAFLAGSAGPRSKCRSDAGRSGVTMKQTNSGKEGRSGIPVLVGDRRLGSA